MTVFIDHDSHNNKTKELAFVQSYTRRHMHALAACHRMAALLPTYVSVSVSDLPFACVVSLASHAFSFGLRLRATVVVLRTTVT